MKIKTDILQKIVAKAMKGVGFNRLIPLSCLMQVDYYGDYIYILTTNGSEFLRVSHGLGSDVCPIERIESFTVYADTFSKLVSKLTAEETTINVKNNILYIESGKGKYQIELPLDSEGNSINFPMPDLIQVPNENSTDYRIGISQIRNIISMCKPALDVSNVSCYSNYYVSNEVIATNRKKIVYMQNLGIDIKEPILINPIAMDLMGLIETDNIGIYRSGNELMFGDLCTKVYTKCVDNISDFAVDAIKGLVNTDFENQITVDKNELLDALDRISVLSSSNSIRPYLTFSSNGMSISSEQADELIDVQNFTGGAEFTCRVDVDLLKPMLKAQTGATVTIAYGLPSAIKLIDTLAVSLVALESDE